MSKFKITERIDNITGMHKEYSAAKIPAPKSCKIEITGNCNYRCQFCAHNQRLRAVGDMNQDFFKRVVKEMVDAGVEELGLFYLGESFITPFLPEAIKYAKDVGIKYTFLTTNGSVSTAKKLNPSFNYRDLKFCEDRMRLLNMKYFTEYGYLRN